MINDKYEEWLTLKVKVSWDLVICHKRTLGGEDIIEMNITIKKLKRKI